MPTQRKHVRKQTKTQATLSHITTTNKASSDNTSMQTNHMNKLTKCRHNGNTYANEQEKRPPTFKSRQKTRQVGKAVKTHDETRITVKPVKTRAKTRQNPSQLVHIAFAHNREQSEYKCAPKSMESEHKQ